MGTTKLALLVILTNITALAANSCYVSQVQETVQECHFSSWIPWDCSECGNNYYAKIKRYRAVCCDKNELQVPCLHRCNIQPGSVQEDIDCGLVCSNLDPTTSRTSTTTKVNNKLPTTRPRSTKASPTRAVAVKTTPSTKKTIYTTSESTAHAINYFQSIKPSTKIKIFSPIGSSKPSSPIVSTMSKTRTTSSFSPTLNGSPVSDKHAPVGTSEAFIPVRDGTGRSTNNASNRSYFTVHSYHTKPVSKIPLMYNSSKMTSLFSGHGYGMTSAQNETHGVGTDLNIQDTRDHNETEWCYVSFWKLRGDPDTLSNVCITVILIVLSLLLLIIFMLIFLVVCLKQRASVEPKVSSPVDPQAIKGVRNDNILNQNAPGQPIDIKPFTDGLSQNSSSNQSMDQYNCSRDRFDLGKSSNKVSPRVEIEEPISGHHQYQTEQW